MAAAAMPKPRAKAPRKPGIRNEAYADQPDISRNATPKSGEKVDSGSAVKVLTTPAANQGMPRNPRPEIQPYTRPADGRVMCSVAMPPRWPGV